ncbi:hypothetical protein A9G41_05575 [Gilliamella sp. Nev5-1]|uniref:hypothetical protein n=1 Tax=unclassified Gilliamella TaxID=2685620 RepID=UPI00080E5E6F|nr:hypothetical protein [Gilliamella apicola]OCG58638.1 hypothetical protein A9G40_09185 [Gilliamella apicola]OCG69768.1 hypothetical protein A9G41_05575 [Gilliamella apicola]
MIQEILTNIRNGPTILTLPEIINLMNSLQLLKTEEILKNDEDFLQLLDLLVESYCDSAIFEVNADNKAYLNQFSRWLIKLGKRHPFGENQDNLSSYSNIFLKEMSNTLI